MRPKPLRLILVRHGETDWNVEHRFQGQSDQPLNAKGHEQAKAVATRLQDSVIDLVISSPLQRALETANAIAAHLNLTVQCDDRLKERHFGVLEGEHYANWTANHPEVWKSVSEHPHSYRLPGGESIDDLTRRVESFLAELVKLHHGQTVAVVCHGQVNRTLLGLLLGIGFDELKHYSIPNTSHSIFDVYENKVEVVDMSQIVITTGTQWRI